MATLREKINKNPGVTISVIVVAAAAALWLALGGKGDKGPSTAYFTTDDGKTWFTDSLDRIPPFQKDGKEAVMCTLYHCKEGNHEFVGIMNRFTPAGRAAMEKYQALRKNPPPAKPGQPPPIIKPAVQLDDVELKHPGEKEWLRATDPRITGSPPPILCPIHKSSPVEGIVAP